MFVDFCVRLLRLDGFCRAWGYCLAPWFSSTSRGRYAMVDRSQVSPLYSLLGDLWEACGGCQLSGWPPAEQGARVHVRYFHACAAWRHPAVGGDMTEPVLRDYQLDLVDKARRAFAARTRRVLLQAPTGSGKTVMFAHIAHRAAQRQARAHPGAPPGAGAADGGQARGVRRRAGPDHRRHPRGGPRPRRRGQRPDARAPAAPVPGRSLGPRGAGRGAPRRGAHLQARARRLPARLSAGCHRDPERLDGRGLDACYDVLLEGPPVRGLIEGGWLADYRVFSHPEHRT
jgi:hypothetical protein